MLVVTLDEADSARVREATRAILASLLGVDRHQIVLDVGSKGKPRLRNDPSLHFSISHSRTVSMVAFTRVAPVGIDVEIIRAVPRADLILKRFFSDDQVAEILSDDNRDLRFVEAWTRSEATVKVRGASIWEAATPDPSVTVRPLSAPDGFAAAIAVAAPEWSVKQIERRLADLG